MKKSEDVKDALIDRFYGEEYNEEVLKDTGLEAEDEELKFALDKMDLIKALNMELDVNILGIIQKAEEINNSKRSKREGIYFILAALVIMSAVTVGTLSQGTRFILYFELIGSFLMPFALIPITKSVLAKGER